MIILHVFAYVANQRYEIYQFGEYEERYKWFTVLTIIAVLTVVAAMHHERFIDTMSYIKTSLNVAPSWDNITRILNGNGKDKAFYILSCMLRGLLGNHYRIYLGIIAVFLPAACVQCISKALQQSVRNVIFVHCIGRVCDVDPQRHPSVHCCVYDFRSHRFVAEQKNTPHILLSS